MNGDELPNLLDALGQWVRQNRDPETGLVFGATVREPVEEHNIKTYGFIKYDGLKPFHLIVWHFGNVSIEWADLTDGSHASDDWHDWTIHNENYEFEEASQVVAKIDSFLRENAPVNSAVFADKTAP